MLAELTYPQEVRLALIHGAAVLIGVLAGLCIGIWQARKAWENESADRQKERDHQVQSERDHLLLTERISLYRRLNEAAADMLLQSALIVVHQSSDVVTLAAQADRVWLGRWPRRG